MKKRINDETTKKSQETQQETLTSENEESDSITDQSSSMSGSLRKKYGNKSTQFSVVQRSGTDGLRMKISAIRTTPAAAVTTKIDINQNKKRSSSSHSTRKKNIEPEEKANLQTKNSRKNKTIVPYVVGINGSTRLSDESESGCSEATSTTTMANQKKVKIKRKKVQSRSNEQKKATSNGKTSNISTAQSSDSEEENLSSQPKTLMSAPLTPFILGNNRTRSLLAATDNVSGIPDNIALSSSDNELPALVNAAIKRVESNSDTEGANSTTGSKTNLHQYQSSLLQDFMVKTQMLGQSIKNLPISAVAANNLTNQKQNQSIAVDKSSTIFNSSCNSSRQALVKKRRGRPKKTPTSLTPIMSKNALNINESGDSGVISTASTTQSTSPSPKSISILKKTSTMTTTTTETIVNSTLEPSVPAAAAATIAAKKPKIDIVSLDKRMYATERVLYPPPRNKRKQSSSMGSKEKQQSAQQKQKQDQQQKLTKNNTKEEQIDPVWREIDVNKKFRRPSVTGYKSDGGASTICSKILASKTGYVSDYVSVYARKSYSGYKSDASCKSRYSGKSCVSRAKTCGFRSDCSTVGGTHRSKSRKFRRKRHRSSMFKGNSKSVGNINEQDILQLAGLSLGQTSEESNEYVCKPTLNNLPTTTSKKYGEINRFITTGEYFGRGNKNRINCFDNITQDVCNNFFGTFSNSLKTPSFSGIVSGTADGGNSSKNNKICFRRKSYFNSSDYPKMPTPSHSSRKIKSRRSSVASFCSSYSGISRVKRRRSRHKSFRSSNKSCIIDSKLLTEIDIITNNFNGMCRIQCDKNSLSKDKEKSERYTIGNDLNKIGQHKTRESRDKRSQKKRKLSEMIDFSFTNVGQISTSSSKRRHKKACSSSPDDHKLPLKKRHYLLSGPGEKNAEVVFGKLHAAAGQSGDLAATIVAGKGGHREIVITATANQQQYKSNSKSRTATTATTTPKKRHLLQTTSSSQYHPALSSDDAHSVSSIKRSHSSPLRIVLDAAAVLAATSIMATPNSAKHLDISPLAKATTTNENIGNKKRTRLEGLVCKIATPTNHNDSTLSSGAGCAGKSIEKSNLSSDPSSICPPPGVFEPTIELEIQIPPIAKLNEHSVITKSEVDSPLDLLEINNKNFTQDSSSAVTVTTTAKIETRVVESLLNKTGGNLILKRKRKKINRTGFPNVKKKKRKVTETSAMNNDEMLSNDLDENTAAVAVDICAAGVGINKRQQNSIAENNNDKICDRVPRTGEASDTFLERANRAPRLSVVSLERLQGTSNKKRGVVGTSAATSDDRSKKSATKTKTNATKINGKRNKEEKNDKIQTKTQRSRKSDSKEEEKLMVATIKKLNKSNSKVATTTKNQEKNKKQPMMLTETTKKTSATKSKSTKSVPLDKNNETKAILPAGIDPNMNFSCKIRLKRGNSIHATAQTTTTGKETKRKPGPASKTLAKSAPVVIFDDRLTPNSESNDENVLSKISIQSAENFVDLLEQDALPFDEAADSESVFSDASDEKSIITRKQTKWKKTYLQAGLFSDFFKTTQSSQISTNNNNNNNNNINNNNNNNNNSNNNKLCTTPTKKNANATLSSILSKESYTTITDYSDNNEIKLLPPPPYCEKFFRRTQSDFLLPYDIWLAYKNSKLPTRETVPSWNYRKIRTNVYAESVRPNLAGFDHPTCNCKLNIGCGDECLNRMVYTECSPTNCPTREKCRNQRIQRHEVAPGVERFMTENKGWGVRTKLPIKKGTYILEYVGEVVTEKEFKERMATMYANDTHHYCLHLDGGLVIDGHRMGSDGRFVNHSCLPNCEMQKWSVNGLSRMALFAARNIEDGEELSYDYNFSLFNPSEGQPCRCNTPQCRGVIGGKSQRVKPLLPIEPKPLEPPKNDERNGHQRKRQARKNTLRLPTKDIVVAKLQPISDKDKKIIKTQRLFLIRNFEKIRKIKTLAEGGNSTVGSTTPTLSSATVQPATQIVSRRPSTPNSLAAQISALRSPRNMKTRVLTLAVNDPEVEKMAKMAIILRELCVFLENIQDNDDKPLINKVSSVMIKKKKPGKPPANAPKSIDFNTIQSNIEKGFYKDPSEFDVDVMRLFANGRQQCCDDKSQLDALNILEEAYVKQKSEKYNQLVELVSDVSSLENFKSNNEERKEIDINVPTQSLATAEEEKSSPISEEVNVKSKKEITRKGNNKSNEDIISCICGLYKDEGLMIQCARCMVWQHTECTKADINADNYLCEKCEPREVDREIPLDDFTEDGYRYYLSLMRGKELQIRQGDTVYVLRDIPIKDKDGKISPTKKHTYETIGKIDYNECDIFRCERLWKDHDGKRFIFGHHFLRPHETFHEPSRRFYPNEVVRVPLYEVVPIELVIGRCWVFDRTTFCKGRPIDCTSEEHVYICELRVDKSARFFSKAKTNYVTCTKNYAFKKFTERLKISKTYAPHEVDPSMLKTKKQKTEAENVVSTPVATTSANVATLSNTSKTEGHNSPSPAMTSAVSSSPLTTKKKQNKSAVSGEISMPVHVVLQKAVKRKRISLENVLNDMKLKNWKNTQSANGPAVDLSYLLTGRGRRRKIVATATAAAVVAAATAVNVPVLLNKTN